MKPDSQAELIARLVAENDRLKEENEALREKVKDYEFELKLNDIR